MSFLGGSDVDIGGECSGDKAEEKTRNRTELIFFIVREVERKVLGVGE